MKTKTKIEIEDVLSAIVVALMFTTLIVFTFYCGMQYEKTHRIEQLRTKLVGGLL